ncbi:MAG: glycosyltransferase family A protein, partial [Thermoplasmatales archaeon]
MPLISVIVSAHDRKKYLKEALGSCLNQTLPRNQYEIIVVKNFIDEEIDKFIQENHLLSVFTENTTLGQKMAAGIERSSGSIICFLDDDDKFVRDKLTYVSDAFKTINNLGYFHNALITIDETGEILKKGLSTYPET